MFSYIVRRILLMFPTLLGITAVVFFVMAFSPGGIGGSLINQAGEMEPEQAKALRDYYNRRYGLDKPAYVQYGRWLNRISPIGFAVEVNPDGSTRLGRFGFKWPDLGKSMSTSRTVGDMYRHALPVTLLLNLLTIPLMYAVGITSGVYAARHRGQWFDVVTSVLYLAFWSIPRIWAGVMLIGFLANRDYLRIFPTGGLNSILADQMTFLPTAAFWPHLGMWTALALGLLGGGACLMHLAGGRGSRSAGRRLMSLPWCVTAGVSAALVGLWLVLFLHRSDLPAIGPLDHGWLLDRLWHLVSPVIVMVYASFAFLSKLMRSALLDNLSADYVRTARAKGVAENAVLWRHAFRNSLIPLITVAASILPALLVGSIITETLFSLPGMGKLMVDAVFSRDRELVMAGALIGGILSMLSILIADICYAIADPRVSYE